MRFLILWVFCGLLPNAMAQNDTAYFIKTVDSETKRPVPLVELRTTHNLLLVSDNQGIICVDEPELQNRDVYFSISSHGYEYPADGFAFRGAKLKVERGKSATLELNRLNRAERIARITGSGRFSHSVKAGLATQEDNESSGIFGCDSVLNAVYKDRLFWVWGDTNRAAYPLGNFHSTGATSSLDIDPEKDFQLAFFGDGKGFVKPIAKMPGEGPTWLTGLAVFPNAEGKNHLTAMYQKVKNFLDVYEVGQCIWNDENEEFEKVQKLDRKSGLPVGHPFQFTDKNGKKWMIYADPLPTLKIPLSYEAWKDPAQHIKVKTDAQFIDVGRGESITPHRGQICWNAFRKKWVMIFTQTEKREASDNRSQLGEVFYAESESPFGPWRDCLKVVTHNRYSFYNPKQRPEFAKEGGRVIYFEGTYTTTFSRAKTPTPRYDYNQVLYRLDVEELFKDAE